MEPALLAYMAGAVVGAWRTDGSPVVKAVHALLWPIGPLAFAITIAVLLAASLVAFPRVALVVLAILGLAGWWLAG